MGAALIGLLDAFNQQGNVLLASRILQLCATGVGGDYLEIEVGATLFRVLIQRSRLVVSKSLGAK